MKVIFKPKGIEVFEAIRVQDNIGKVLIDKDGIKQEIINEDGQLWLVENSTSEETFGETKLIGVVNQKISLKESDMLIKVDKGYTKPIAQFIEINKPLEKAIQKINEIK